MPSANSLQFILSDGAKLAYDVFGLENGTKRPIILIGGMSSLKIDWEPLVAPLSQCRPVMVYDHRGIGDSTYSTPARNDNITIEMMARDLLALIEHLGWMDIDILGFSMGGVILQQLLLLPENHSRPTSLSFRIRHVILTGTMCCAIQHEVPVPQLKPELLHPVRPLTIDQKKDLARPLLDASLGPQWITRAENRQRYEWWLERMIVGRPLRTIVKQRKALGSFDFRQELKKLPRSIKILVIHGEDDLIVPFSAGLQIIESIPHARAVARGLGKGQVPSYKFGHIWYEYFGVEIWQNVIESFVDDKLVPSESARL